MDSDRIFCANPIFISVLIFVIFAGAILCGRLSRQPAKYFLSYRIKITHRYTVFVKCEEQLINTSNMLPF